MHLGESCVARAELPQPAQALLPPLWNVLPSLPDPEALPAPVRTLRGASPAQQHGQSGWHLSALHGRAVCPRWEPPALREGGFLSTRRAE